MADLLALLPQPKNQFRKAAAREQSQQPVAATVIEPPAYGNRAGFVPRQVEDFGDGGAFPEIHILQYPLDLGRKDKAVASRTAPLQVDSEGNIKYDMILRQNMRKDVTMYSSYTDLMEKELPESALVKPSLEEEQKTAERTRAALAAKIQARIAAAQPKQEKQEPVFIRYTPSSTSDQHNSGASQRIIRLQEMPRDPLEPPRFIHKKVPTGPGSPPPPVMHSPPRKVTAADQANWKIPPCVSNWKNIKGYTIPLDKRLAADGRGLQEVQINDRFAKLSESLLIAERTARKEIEARAAMHRTVARAQREGQEEELRKLAARARAGAKVDEENEDRDEEDYKPETEESIAERDAREELRKDRRREMKRELRMEAIAAETKKNSKSKAAREAERDVSEKIALGQTVKGNKDGLFDQRLFNQAEGMNAGFRGEESYDVYDKPLFKGAASTYIYRAKKDGEGELLKDAEEVSEKDAEGRVAKLLEKGTARFQADRAFKGTEDGGTGAPRSQPVQFEKESEDLFGLGELLGEARSGGGGGDGGKKRTLDSIGGRGHLTASAGGASSRAEDYKGFNAHAPREMQFEEASSSSSSSSSRSDRDRSDRDRSDRGRSDRDSDRRDRDRSDRDRRDDGDDRSKRHRTR